MHVNGIRLLGGAGVQFIGSKETIARTNGRSYVPSMLCNENGAQAGDMFGILVPGGFTAHGAFNLLGYCHDIPQWDNSQGLRMPDGSNLHWHYPGAPYMVHHYKLNEIAKLSSIAVFGSNPGNMWLFAGDCKAHRGSDIPVDFDWIQISNGHRGMMYRGARNTLGGGIQKKIQAMHV